MYDWLNKPNLINYMTGCVYRADGKRKQTDKSDCELDQTSLAVKLRERSLVCLTVWTWLAEQYKSK
jgi:hypothetical protein